MGGGHSPRKLLLCSRAGEVGEGGGERGISMLRLALSRGHVRMVEGVARYV